MEARWESETAWGAQEPVPSHASETRETLRITPREKVGAALEPGDALGHAGTGLEKFSADPRMVPNAPQSPQRLPIETPRNS